MVKECKNFDEYLRIHSTFNPINPNNEEEEEQKGYPGPPK
jgi:hypothetical protein